MATLETDNVGSNSILTAEIIEEKSDRLRRIKIRIEKMDKNNQISALVNTGLDANETNTITSFAHEMEQFLKAKFVFKEDDPSNKRDAYYSLYTGYAKKLTYKSKISEGVIKTLVLLYFFRQFNSGFKFCLSDNEIRALLIFDIIFLLVPT